MQSPRNPRVFSLFAVLILVAGVSPLQAAPPGHLWSQRFGDTISDIGYSVAVDASGNTVATGYFRGTVDFGGGGLVSAGTSDIFLAKYDANGAHLWSKRFGSTSVDEGYSVAIDASGNVVVTGTFGLTVDFGGGGLVSAGTRDIFLAKYDANGAHLWSKRFGSTGAEDGNGVAIDGSGNVVVTGIFFGTVNFGGGNLVSAGGSYDAFLAKYDASGAHQWSKRFGASGVVDEGLDVAVDGSGNVVVTGSFEGTVNFGGGNLVSAGVSDIFLAKYDASGAHQWSKRFGDFSKDVGHALAVDAAGGVVMTGEFIRDVNFGGGVLSSAGGSPDIFVAKFDGSGVHQWSRRSGSTMNDQGYAVAVDGSGSTVVTGRFQGTVDFGGGGLVSASGSLDIFLAKYDANGAHQWSQRFGSTGSDEGYDVAVDGSGNTVATGYFYFTVDFGGGGLVSAGLQEIFLAKFGELPVPVLITRFDATARAGAVEVRWEVWSDEGLDRFVLYRWDDGRPSAVVVAEGVFDPESPSYVDANVEAGATYGYELVIHTRAGEDIRSQTATVTVPLFESALGQNAPNPFNPRTTIEYTLAERANAAVNIYDAAGRLVTRLDQGVRGPGSYRVDWDGRDRNGKTVGSGVYFYRLEGVPGVGPRKMLLLK